MCSEVVLPFSRYTSHSKKLRSKVQLNVDCRTWRAFYNLLGDPIGRGYAGKVYKITPLNLSENALYDASNFLKFCDLQLNGKCFLACKAIRRLRFGKDTIEKIKKEISTMIKLQSKYSLSIDTSFLTLFNINNLLNLQCFAPKSASPKLYAVHEDSTEVAIIMEYAEGGSLYTMCKNNYKRSSDRTLYFNNIENCTESFSNNLLSFGNCRSSCINNLNTYCVDDYCTELSENYVVQLMIKILEALTYMHEKLKIVHLDIKAENILLRHEYPSTDLFITDFGLATELTDGKQHRELAGTPDYVAPEIINYDPVSFATDMWSVGVLTYFLLTGVSPFLDLDQPLTMANITHAKLEFPRALFATRSTQCIDFISSLIQRKPSNRLTAQQSLQHEWIQMHSNHQHHHHRDPLDDLAQPAQLLLAPQTEHNLAMDVCYLDNWEMVEESRINAVEVHDLVPCANCVAVCQQHVTVVHNNDIFPPNNCIEASSETSNQRRICESKRLDENTKLGSVWFYSTQFISFIYTSLAHRYAKPPPSHGHGSSKNAPSIAQSCDVQTASVVSHDEMSPLANVDECNCPTIQQIVNNQPDCQTSSDVEKVNMSEMVFGQNLATFMKLLINIFFLMFHFLSHLKRHD